MFQTLYKQHATSPKNFGKPEKFSHFAEAENPVCGDETEFFMTIQNGKIIKIHHETRGCAGSIACASYLSELILGKEISEIEITDLKTKILNDLGLSNTKKHCVDLVEKALEQILYKEN